MFLSTDLPFLNDLFALFDRKRTFTVYQLKTRVQQRLQLRFCRIDQIVSLIQLGRVSMQFTEADLVIVESARKIFYIVFTLELIMDLLACDRLFSEY